MNMWDHLVVMGVSGTGKSTVAGAVAAATGRVFIEGDELHPEANRQRMGAGVPLTDRERTPWLDRIVDVLNDYGDAGQQTVLACSALKKRYRDRLREARGRCFFVHLQADAQLLRLRMETRPDHFMPPSLLDSQLSTVEHLTVEERGISVDSTQGVDWLVEEIALRLSIEKP